MCGLFLPFSVPTTHVISVSYFLFLFIRMIELNSKDNFDNGNTPKYDK